MKRFVAVVIVAALGGSIFAQDRPDLLLADFEGETYGAWKTTGDAFGAGPARGTLPGQMHVDGYKGRGLVNSFRGGDGGIGTLTSPEFKIERKYITFLIGGGKDPEKLRLDLRIDAKPVRTATGPNDRPGGSERLAPGIWDVAEFTGKTASIQIVDQATGGWGHINVDHIVQTDRPPALPRTNVVREIAVDKRYLNIPIKNGAPKRIVTMAVDGQTIVTNEMELADEVPDWWAFVDVSAWRGKKLSLTVNELPGDSHALEAIEAGDAIKDADKLYAERLRPQFHFSSRRGWLNDPNGLVCFGGEYHLFYQHNPYGWAWGNMHWGHAVSSDLVHWRELPDALMPDRFGPMFSGSAVVDRNNTSGLGEAGKPPLVLIYTAAGNPTVQCLASSVDGRTFVKYAGNPVVKQIAGGNRDPKVFRHEPTGKWVMVLYVGVKGIETIHILTSPNLRDWTLGSVVEGGHGGDRFLFECPDFFELAVDGDPLRKRWVLTAANAEYAIGAFDGTKFTPEKTRLPSQRGRGFYAAQTFSDVPDGRRIQIGWFQTETRGMPFNQSMTIPQELKLVSTPDGPRLTRTPVKELEALRTKTHDFGSFTQMPGEGRSVQSTSELLELRAEFAPGDSAETTFALGGATIAYDARKQEIVVNGHRVPALLRDGKQRLTAYLDRTGLEVFASDGLVYVPMPFSARTAPSTIRVRT
ncbi:MAG TPA: glycoside hydrolase family 32 protein, partial [Gemmataceae bacterium]|nr:glycoside hydrolase family 32 protein [Gemmataceae bacterium]